jgi:hypothetical protein
MTAFAALFGAALFVASLLAPPAFADEPLVGTWNMVSWVAEDLETKEQKQVFGQHPAGLAIFTAEKRILSLFTAEGRTSPVTDADRAKLFLAMYSIAGKYRVEGNKYFVTVAVAQNPAWVGTQLFREFKVEGNRLTVTSAPAPGGPLMGGHMMKATTVYERVTQ